MITAAVSKKSGAPATNSPTAEAAHAVLVPRPMRLSMSKLHRRTEATKERTKPRPNPKNTALPRRAAPKRATAPGPSAPMESAMADAARTSAAATGHARIVDAAPEAPSVRSPTGASR